MSEQQAYWLALLRAPRIGSRTAFDLLSRYGSPEKIFAHAESFSPKEFAETSLAYFKQPNWEIIDKDLAWLSQTDNRLITIEDKHYPERLKQLADPPIALFAHGHLELLNSIQLAIVGSRNPSPTGKQNAFNFAKHLSDSGLIITSGLASGVDGSAHQGALQGNGLTIAVAGTGLDRVYPAEHKQLAHQIAEQGLLISEYPLGTPPIASNFPRRNRIVSGLSLGVLVVEAGVQSGSLITARCAIEQNREVFAIPGSIHHPLAKGCHKLIRQGAKLVETADDIIEELAPMIELSYFNPQQSMQKSDDIDTIVDMELDEDYRQLLTFMSYEPISIDELVINTSYTAEMISSMLLMLELDGLVLAMPGGQYCQIKK